VNKIAEAKALLEENGYLVVRRFQLGSWTTPRDLCEHIGIDGHTLARHLKDKDCPKVIQKRGPKGRLRFLRPTEELITFLLRNKRSS
jgi:hypothetical protein